MDKNRILALNNVIYQIYNTEDFEEMKVNFLTSVQTVIPCLFATIFMAEDPCGENIICDPVCVPKQYEEMERNYPNIREHDYSRWIIRRKESMVMNSSELLPESERVGTEFYKRFYEPYGVHYSLYLTIATHNEFLGIVVLYRGKKEADFSEGDAFVLQLLSEHLNARFYQQWMGERAGDKVSGYPGRNPVRTSGKDIGGYIARYGLTEREAEILGMIFDGIRNQEICDRLVISGNTLKKHLQNIYRKTGVSGRTRLLGLEL